jgi:tetratricopeptide (TPR) repeat protein
VLIPNPDQLVAITKLKQGDLEEISFAVLLHALASQERSAVLEIERKPLKKEIVLEKGIPVDCRSNLLHETLGRFMIVQGLLSEEQSQNAMNKAASHGLPLGEILILEGLISASDLYKVLQQNLAKKLLDGFSWRSGTFRLSDELPKVESPLKVKTPQLVVTGISKFAPDEEVNEAVGPLVGKKLYVHPSPPYPLAEIHLAKEQKQLTRLLVSGKRIDELAAETTIPFDKIMRLLYSLAILGIVVPEEWLPHDSQPAEPLPDDTIDESLSTLTIAADLIDPAEKRDEVMEAYLKYRKQDAFALFGLAETATMDDFQTQYLEFSHRFAPWTFNTPELKGLREKAEDLFLAGGMAFGELCDVERRNAILTRRATLLEEQRRRPDPERFAIKSQLLDSELQFKKGKALMQSNKYREALMQLQFAYDCDPQNPTYRSELAYCRFLDTPQREAQRSLDDLRETMRIDPKCGLAVYYAGDIHRQLGNFDEAANYLEKAIKMMTPDRRPIEAMKSLQAQVKTKKKGLLGALKK